MFLAAIHNLADSRSPKVPRLDDVKLGVGWRPGFLLLCADPPSVEPTSKMPTVNFPTAKIEVGDLNY